MFVRNQTRKEKDKDWDAISKYFTNIGQQLSQLQNDSDATQIKVPELNTFEQLLSSIDHEHNSTPNTKNDISIHSGINNEFDFDFGFASDIVSLQHHMDRD